MYNFKDVTNFDWEELNGKTLKIVSSDSITVGFDGEGNCFVLRLDLESLKTTLLEESNNNKEDNNNDNRDYYIPDGSGD